MKLLKKFQKIKPHVPYGRHDRDDVVFVEEDLTIIKEVAELMNALSEALDKAPFDVRRKLSPLIKETEYWSASSFDC